MCPMDIAIRGANWCLTLDILRSAGFSLEKHDLNIITTAYMITEVISCDIWSGLKIVLITISPIFAA